MRIAVVDLVSFDGGALTITKSIYDYLSKGNNTEHEWFFFISDQPFQETEFVKIYRFPAARSGYFGRAKVELIDVNRTIRKIGIDRVVCMSNMTILGCKTPQYIYLQQSIPFQKEKKFSFLKAEERNLAIRQTIQGAIIKHSVSKAKAVFVQTKWILDAVSETVPGAQVICVGYPREKNDATSKKDVSLSKVFFYPCGPAIYKNIPVIVDAVDILECAGYSFQFLITLTKDQLLSLCGRTDVNSDTFVCLGKIPHNQVEDLYYKTTLVFSSYIETLGLPLVEAREAGTWIIASDCAFSHEVLDDYQNKSFFNPFSKEQLARKMKDVLDGTVELNAVPSGVEEEKESCWQRMISYL